MIADHRKAPAELSNIAKSQPIRVPVKLDAEHVQMLDSSGNVGNPESSNGC